MPGIVKLEEPDPIPEPANDTPSAAAVGRQRKIPQNAANGSVSSSSASVGKKYGGKNKGRGKTNKNAADVFDNAEAERPVTLKKVSLIVSFE